MHIPRRLAAVTVGLLLSTSVLAGQDLSAYREFTLGMDQASVLEKTRTNPASVQRVHHRPAAIDELSWRPRPAPTSDPGQADPVEEIVFTFYNDALFRIVVTYARARVEGLTHDDIAESISAIYGDATHPTTAISSAPLSRRYPSGTDPVLVRWEDAEHSLDLIRPSYGPAFAIVLYSKQLDADASVAVSEARRLDLEEAPQRAIERRKQEAADARAAEEKARRLNQPAFRP